jgi:hypothetical protein
MREEKSSTIVMKKNSMKDCFKSKFRLIEYNTSNIETRKEKIWFIIMKYRRGRVSEKGRKHIMSGHTSHPCLLYKFVVYILTIWIDKDERKLIVNPFESMRGKKERSMFS